MNRVMVARSGESTALAVASCMHRMTRTRREDMFSSSVGK